MAEQLVLTYFAVHSRRWLLLLRRNGSGKKDEGDVVGEKIKEPLTGDWMGIVAHSRSVGISRTNVL